ncbi:replication initiation protein [Pelagimonas varians]|uniref:Initiator Replication protein n=1 Tax=Pelagimonas varians TaxID=696760 RepID=A0A238L8S4_9RHOB|nr:replication initiation protein [Pelagimonas varians]PYG24701.1 replication initiator protein [Pelagimonas varians]SMX50716.1 Initiator Replication protein [Pelagimonas varians]
MKSIEATTDQGQMVKPRELIEIRGAGPLTLSERRAFNILLDHAWGKDLLQPQHTFTIPTNNLKQDGQTNQRLKRSLRHLQQTLVIVIKPNGDEVTSQLLGSTRVKPNGDLTYSFPAELSDLLKDSSVFAKLDLEVMKSFSSKYAFALYEEISRRINLSHKMTEELDVQDLRDLLGVEDGKLSTHHNLRTKALEPALTEVNAITPYQVTILPKKKGRKVLGFVMGWSVKDISGMKKAYAELQQPKVGRKSRLEGTQASVIDC